MGSFLEKGEKKKDKKRKEKKNNVPRKKLSKFTMPIVPKKAS